MKELSLSCNPNVDSPPERLEWSCLASAAWKLIILVLLEETSGDGSVGNQMVDVGEWLKRENVVSGGTCR